MSFLSIGHDDEVGPVRRDGRLHRRARVDHRHLDVVPELGERDPRALAEAVVGGGEEEDAHSSEETREAPRSIL